MTRRLDEAIEKVRALPADDQDRLADVLLAVVEESGSNYRLTDEQIAAIERAQESARRGDFATDEEMDELWRRFGLA
jgi:hypothetical protein